MSGYRARPLLKGLLQEATVAVFSALLTGCGPAGTPVPGVNGSGPQMHPELLDVPDSPAYPGQTITVRFPGGTARGLAWVLEERKGDTWQARYHLSAVTAGYAGSGSPTWWSADDGEGRAWSAIGIGGTGPDTLAIPDSTGPGTYRLCTGDGPAHGYGTRPLAWCGLRQDH